MSTLSRYISIVVLGVLFASSVAFAQPTTIPNSKRVAPQPFGAENQVGVGDYQSINAVSQTNSYATPASGPLSLQNVLDIITEIRNFLIVLGVIVVVIFVIWGGVDYITSRGDEEKVSAAKQKIIVAIIGAAIILVVFILLQTLKAVLEQRTLFVSQANPNFQSNLQTNL